LAHAIPRRVPVDDVARHARRSPECRAAWLIDVTVRECREMEAGERVPDEDTWRRMCDVHAFPLSFTRWLQAVRVAGKGSWVR
jgi:hypothetical protein